MDAKELTATLMHTMGRMRKLNMHPTHGGLNKGEHMMLFTIYHMEMHQNSNIKPSDLSCKMQMSKPAATQTLNALEKKGMIVRVQDEHDRRVARITITDKGKAMLDKFWQEMNHIVNRVVERLGEEDTNKLIELSSKLYDILEELAKEYDEREDNA